MRLCTDGNVLGARSSDGLVGECLALCVAALTVNLKVVHLLLLYSKRLRDVSDVLEHDPLGASSGSELHAYRAGVDESAGRNSNRDNGNVLARVHC